MRRKALSKRVRFEVFKRDSFACQYCGRSAPDVVLQVDHINPVAKGGDDDPMNLITSCVDCNAGKSDKALDDDAAIAKRKAQLDALQERREQLEMMIEWQQGLINLGTQEVDSLVAFWNEQIIGYRLTDSGIETVRDLLKRYSVSEILEAMRRSAQYYLVHDEGGKLTPASVDKALDYIGRICHVNQQTKDRPYLGDLYYVRGVMRKRYSYVCEWEVMSLLERAFLAGYNRDALKDSVLACHNWTAWRGLITDIIAEAADGKE